ncbi:unnamed protein product [Moneuplotes crassus]|uniref:Uncharacterized protein n=1 Tax=Euplotes crassus TaxID=5936 RepID=A0AAD1XKY3_EUPCR|nr:unnamed protein product [Moneuplotes crassus]
MKNAIFALMAVMMLTSSVVSVQARATGLKKNLKAQPTVQELFDSFLEGFDVNSFVTNSTECIHKTEKGYVDISEAVNHLIHRGWTWENHLDLLGSFGNMTPITRTCFDVAVGARDQITDFFGNFDGFIDFATQVKDGAIANAWEWYTISSAIVSSIQGNRPKEVAFQAGKALALLFKFNPRFTAQDIVKTIVSLPSLKPLEDFLVGFIEGSTVFDSENIKGCVSETEFLVQSVEDANKEFSRGTEAGFREGVFEIADVFERLKPLNEGCYKGANDVIRIVTNMYNTFNSPLDIVINAARNGPAISASALGLYQAFRNENWKTVGREGGRIFFYVFKTG